jgi:hypothetical protein
VKFAPVVVVVDGHGRAFERVLVRVERALGANIHALVQGPCWDEKEEDTTTREAGGSAEQDWNDGDDKRCVFLLAFVGLGAAGAGTLLLCSWAAAQAGRQGTVCRVP